MRRSKPMSSRPPAARVAIVSALACAVLGAVAPAPAGAANLYADTVQNPSGNGNQLSQYSIGASGALTDLPAAALGTNGKDIAITPDGRFAYVTANVNAV